MMSWKSLGAIGLVALLPASELLAQEGVWSRPAKTAKKEVERLKAGDAAPGFELRDLEGKKVSLRKLRGLPDAPAAVEASDSDAKKEPKGKIVVLDFWSVRCPVSKGWEPRLKQICAKYSKRDVVFVAINSNRAGEDERTHEGNEEIREYCKKHAIPYTVLVDEKSQVADRFGAACTPDIFVVGPDGKLCYTGLIDSNYREEDPEKVHHYLSDALDAILAGKAPGVRDIAPKGCSIKRAGKARTASGR